MANETVTKSQRFYCVSLIPDICKTPLGPATPPVPYNIIAEFSDATGVSPNVKSRSEAVILHQRSVIPTVQGDAAGTAGGIKSGTCGQRVESKTASATYKANGTQTVQVGCEVWMNERNTVGKIYERGGVTPRPRLQQPGAPAATTSEASAGAQGALVAGARRYKDQVSEALHGFGAGAMEQGGKVVAGSWALGGAGLAVAASGVGAPVAAALGVGAAAGATVGGVVTSVGAAAEAGATLCDYAADFLLTGKTPALLDAATDIAVDIAEKIALRKVLAMGSWAAKQFPRLGQLFGESSLPGKPPRHPPEPGPPRPPERPAGGRTSRKKQEKSDKPADCCPKNTTPGGKPVASRHPVHFGTGEEVLYQTDFVLAGALPLAWTRCYRSGSEVQDWGWLGARWSVPFMACLLLSAEGIVYIDDSGRPVCLPALAPGQSLDSRKEGFLLARSGPDELTLTWRDGSVDSFVHEAAVPQAWLPHGYDGVNAMRAPGLPVAAQCFTLRRSAARDGRGYSVERYPQARPGAVLLRLRSDDGRLLEAMREDERGGQRGDERDGAASPRIGQVDEVRADGTRICQVRYRYAPEAHYAASAPDPAVEYEAGFGPDAPAGDGTFARLPARHNLVGQTNPAGAVRTYAYRHHLLTGYTSYTGFAHSLAWISLAALRERWHGSPFDDARLLEQCPLTLANSYQARATETGTADGRDGVRIAYPSADTSRVTDALGGVLDYTFDANWLATEVRRLAPDGSAVLLGRRVWDRDGMLLADSDGVGHGSRFTYDGAGNVVTHSDALGHTSRIEYGAANQPVALTDALGHVTRLSYDGAGRLLASTDALEHSTHYRYDAQGDLAERQDAHGGIQRFLYDRQGRLTQATDCSGFSTHYRYHPDGSLAVVTDALDHSTHYEYDALGQLSAVTLPDGARESMRYDADGHLLEHSDALGRRTRFAYDGHGMPVARTDALGQTLQYRYDATLRLVELVNAGGERYQLTYHAEGWLLAETDFDGKTTSYTYDSAGQLRASACHGQHTAYVRDALGRLLAKETADGACRYAYDALGRLVAVASPDAQQRFRFDVLGQLVEERTLYRPASGPVPSLLPKSDAGAGFVLTHAYDALGKRIETVLPNGRRIDTLRYGAGHWHGTLWQGQTVAAIERDRLHRETGRTLGATGNVSAQRSYDPQSRLTALTVARHGGAGTAPAPLPPLRARRFSYDLAGQLTRLEHGRDASAETLGTQDYGYDPLGQLLSAVQPGLSERFAFDPAGNLLDAAAVDTATAPAQAGPKPSHNHQGYAYTDDEYGNLRRKARIAPDDYARDELDLTYDAEQRLIRAVRTQHRQRHTAHYRYDALHRRIAKHVVEERWDARQNAATDAPQSRRGERRLFVWDGDILAQEIGEDQTVSYVYEPDSAVPLARIESAGGLADDARYQVHLPRVPEWDMPLARHDPAQEDQAEAGQQDAWRRRLIEADGAAPGDRIAHYSCDHLGTPRELIDAQGRIVWSARYRAWGRVLHEEVRTVEQRLRFQGQYDDAETGLHYNRYRYYDPESARYTTPDPIGLLGGWNAYAYAPNPTGWVDPLGLAKSTCPRHLKCDPCANLPASILDTFEDRKATGRLTLQDEILYKYHGDSNRTGRKYAWLTNKTYATETGMRRALAIRRDWGVTITKISSFNVPMGTWICEGKAATQGKGYPGRGYQAVVTNIPRAWIIKTEGAF